MAPTKRSRTAAVREEPNEADQQAVRHWLEGRRDVIAADRFMHPTLKKILSDEQMLAPVLAPAGLAPELGLTPHRLWTLSVSEQPQPHPSRFIARPGVPVPLGAGKEWLIHSGRAKWVASPTRAELLKVKPRFGMPRPTGRTARRKAAPASTRSVPAHRLAKLAAQREKRFQARQKAIRANKTLHPDLQEKLLDRQIWTIGTASTEFGIGIARLGFTRSPAPTGWFTLEPDTVEGFAAGREITGIEAGRARQWAMDNGWITWDQRWITWDHQALRLILADPAPQPPLTAVMLDWQDTVRADRLMHPVLKDLLLDMRPCDLSRASEELDITVYRLERLRAAGAFVDPGWWYPNGTVPLGLLRLWAMHSGRLKWIGRAELLVPVLPRHGHPVQALNTRRRRNPRRVSRMEEKKNIA